MYKISIDKIITLIIILTIISIYYLLGPAKFPDYDNYLKIVSGQLYDNKVFEWVPQVWFEGIYSKSRSLNFAVDSYVVLVQLFFVATVIVLKDKFLQRSLMWIVVMFGALYMTTTIRAAIPCVASLYLYVFRNQSVFKCISIIILMLSFHDSSIVLAVIWILYRVTNEFALVKSKMARWLIMLLLCIALILMKVLIEDWSNIVLKYNYSSVADYISSEQRESSLVKDIYIGLNIFVAIVILRKYNFNNYLLWLTIVTLMVYALSPVAGIRISQYLTIAIIYELVLNSIYIQPGWSLKKISLMTFIGLPLFILNLFEVLRHAN